MRTHDALKASGFAECRCGTYDILNNLGQCTECEDSEEAVANEVDFVLRTLNTMSKMRDHETRQQWATQYFESHPNMHPTIRALIEDEVVRCVDCGELLQLTDMFTDYRCNMCVSTRADRSATSSR